MSLYSECMMKNHCVIFLVLYNICVHTEYRDFCYSYSMDDIRVNHIFDHKFQFFFVRKSRNEMKLNCMKVIVYEVQREEGGDFDGGFL